MKCIYCGGKLQVSNSRSQVKLNRVWRRRFCAKCNALFTSIEEIDYSDVLSVKKSATDLEPFSRDELFISIYESLKYRETAIRDAKYLTDTTIGSLLLKLESGLVTPGQISKITYSILKRFDSVAATHYKAYH